MRKNEDDYQGEWDWRDHGLAWWILSWFACDGCRPWGD